MSTKNELVALFCNIDVKIEFKTSFLPRFDILHGKKAKKIVFRKGPYAGPKRAYIKRVPEMNSPSIFYPDLIPHMVIEKIVNRAPKGPLDLERDLV